MKEGKPFLIWHNTTRMHIWTHLQPKYQDMVPEKGLYGAGMTEFDDNIGVLLKKLGDLGIADNTIVIITTDNGTETARFLQSVWLFNTAFHVLQCHPWPCMLLNLRLHADSSTSFPFRVRGRARDISAVLVVQCPLRETPK